ncbi:flippase [Streptococcus sp. zg-JUN1979]|uniref:flippase n=1 Tax=Streptococcus sp. zg-JUN1979 TaxID=3391450 RepID=UPI0039A76C11
MTSKNSSLKLNSLLNVIRQLCVIIFPIITFPYASRVLGATNYGKVNFGLSIVSYILLIAGLGITNYAIREGARVRENTDKIQGFINQIFTLNIYSTIVAYIVLAVLLIFWDDLKPYTALIMVQSITVFFTTFGVDWINSIYEDYFYITLRYIICQIIAVVLMFTLVKDKDDYVIYALVMASSTVLANIWNWFHISKYQLKLRIVSLKETFPHWKPVLILFGSAVASLIYINSDITILGILSTNERVGYYSVSVKVYTLVKQLINAALIVAIPRFSYHLAQGNKEEVEKQLTILQSGLLVIAGPAMMGVFVLSKEIITFLAGSAYLPATSSLQLLSIALLFAILANLYINVIMIPLKKEKHILVATFVSAIINIVLNFALIPSLQENGAAIATVIAEAVMALMGWFAVRKSVHLTFMKPIIVTSLASIWVYVSYQQVSVLFSHNIVILIATILISIIGVAVIVLITYHKEMRGFLKK